MISFSSKQCRNLFVENGLKTRVCNYDVVGYLRDGFHARKMLARWILRRSLQGLPCCRKCTNSEWTLTSESLTFFQRSVTSVSIPKTAPEVPGRAITIARCPQTVPESLSRLLHRTTENRIRIVKQVILFLFTDAIRHNHPSTPLFALS